MPEAHITRRTGLDQIAAWAGPHLTLRCSQQSSFELFAEAAAIAKIQELTVAGTELTLAYSTAFPPGPLADASLGILNQPFGIAALQVAHSLRDHTGSDARAGVLRQIWQELTTAQGFLGSGSSVFALARDPDVPVPQFLRERTEQMFPLRGTFARFLRRAAHALAGEDFAYGGAETELVTFLYESAQNSFDHAREDPEGNPIRGTRGLTIQKIVFNSRDEVEPRQLTPLVTAYINRVWPSDEPHLKIFALTTFDVGPGIQHTLPALNGESAQQRFTRAFAKGVSRKPQSAGANRGYGLPVLLDSLQASQQLKSLLYVSAAEIMSYQDFSTNGTWEFLTTEYPKRTGTALTLLWPIIPQREGQGTLFEATA
jgi:hypothetical protein